MTSLEFIEKEIKQLEKRKEQAFKNEYYSVYKECSQKITTLQQIKSELEAWEVCKKHYHINKYEDINKGRDKKRFDITIWLNTENCDFKSCASYEDILKVKKALEVSDES